MEYENCLVELDEVLKYLSIENLSKIPSEILKGIKEKKSKNYIWRYDETKELREQKLNRKTIIMLSYLNYEYLLNNEQKEYMDKLHSLNEQQLEKEKQQKYNVNDLFSSRNNKDIAQVINVSLIDIKKEKWYSKIFRFIKNMFS